MEQLLWWPVFALSWTSETGGFNKQFLFYALVTLGILSWLGKRDYGEKIGSPHQRPRYSLGAFLAVRAHFVTRLQRQNHELLGDWSAFKLGFVPLTFYILFLFLVVNNVKEAKTNLKHRRFSWARRPWPRFCIL